MKSAIYAGSFDPFTNGHLDILRQASKLFDVVHMVFANNTHKARIFELDQMMIATNKTIKEAGISCCQVYSTNRLISDFAKDYDTNYLIRGLRNPNDYNYEENIAKLNNELNPDLHTIYLRADNEIISSSMVKELYKYGKDVSKYVSPFVLGVMKNGCC